MSVGEETVREVEFTPEHKAIVADYLARHGGVQNPSAGDAGEPEAKDPASPEKKDVEE